MVVGCCNSRGASSSSMRCRISGSGLFRRAATVRGWPCRWRGAEVADGAPLRLGRSRVAVARRRGRARVVLLRGVNREPDPDSGVRRRRSARRASNRSTSKISSTVPDGVPSVTHSSVPFTPFRAANSARPPGNASRLLGEELAAPPAMSESRTVPAVVPSVIHSSRPEAASVATKRTRPLSNGVKSPGVEFPPPALMSLRSALPSIVRWYYSSDPVSALVALNTMYAMVSFLPTAHQKSETDRASPGRTSRPRPRLLGRDRGSDVRHARPRAQDRLRLPPVGASGEPPKASAACPGALRLRRGRRGARAPRGRRTGRVQPRWGRGDADLGRGPARGGASVSAPALVCLRRAKRSYCRPFRQRSRGPRRGAAASGPSQQGHAGCGGSRGRSAP